MSHLPTVINISPAKASFRPFPQSWFKENLKSYAMNMHAYYPFSVNKTCKNVQLICFINTQRILRGDEKI